MRSTKKGSSAKIVLQYFLHKASSIFQLIAFNFVNLLQCSKNVYTMYNHMKGEVLRADWKK